MGWFIFSLWFYLHLLVANWVDFVRGRAYNYVVILEFAVAGVV